MHHGLLDIHANSLLCFDLRGPAETNRASSHTMSQMQIQFQLKPYKTRTCFKSQKTISNGETPKPLLANKDSVLFYILSVEGASPQHSSLTKPGQCSDSGVMGAGGRKAKKTFHPPTPKQLSFLFPDRRKVCANKFILSYIIRLYLRKENNTADSYVSLDQGQAVFFS